MSQKLEEEMCILDEKPLAELNAMSQADLIAAVVQDRRNTVAVNEYDAKGNLIRQTQTTTDAYDALVGTVTMEPTYYGTGEVDVITITERDAADKVSGGYRLKHYLDGKQPELLALSVGKEEAELGLGDPEGAELGLGGPRGE